MQRKHVNNGTYYEEVIGFSRAVRVGPYISVGGTAPIGEDGSTVGPGDAAAQTKRCYEIIQDALERAGSGLKHVVRNRILLTNIDDWEAVVKVRAEFLREVRPVDTIMEVSRFVNPEWLVEIEVDAVVENWEEA